MGIEYRIQFCSPNDEAVAVELRQIAAARETILATQFDIGTCGDKGWPCASVTIEKGGAYFCNNGGQAGRSIMGEVIARLTAFGPVTIEEI